MVPGETGLAGRSQIWDGAAAAAAKCSTLYKALILHTPLPAASRSPVTSSPWSRPVIPASKILQVKNAWGEKNQKMMMQSPVLGPSCPSLALRVPSGEVGKCAKALFSHQLSLGFSNQLLNLITTACLWLPSSQNNFDSETLSYAF